MIGRGIAVAGTWLGVGIAMGMMSAHAALPGWVYKWLLVCAVIVTLPIVLPLMSPGPWTKE